ncbi:MAG: hypothetical protein ACM4D3_13240 [Candidatus Sericytochromatia bacterium]
MRQLTRFMAAAAATVMTATSGALALGASVAAADDTSGRVVPLSSVLRRCDWSSAPYVPSDSRGSGYAVISQNGSTASADIYIQAMRPDIWYGVRFIQVPRPGIGCGAGDPGVGMARIYTDGAGNGSATVSAPLMNGATGAWVSVEGPLGVQNQLTGDFWTSDYVASF